MSSTARLVVAVVVIAVLVYLVLELRKALPAGIYQLNADAVTWNLFGNNKGVISASGQGSQADNDANVLKATTAAAGPVGGPVAAWMLSGSNQTYTTYNTALQTLNGEPLPGTGGTQGNKGAATAIQSVEKFIVSLA